LRKLTGYQDDRHHEHEQPERHVDVYDADRLGQGGHYGVNDISHRSWSVLSCPVLCSPVLSFPSQPLTLSFTLSFPRPFRPDTGAGERKSLFQQSPEGHRREEEKKETVPEQEAHEREASNTITAAAGVAAAAAGAAATGGRVRVS